jgi:hypothetical protein
MEIYHFLSLLIILLSFSKIKNETYTFNKFSDLKCDKSNYIETFQAHTCGKKKLEYSLYFSFVLQDTKKKSHSIQCLIEISTSLRNLQGSTNQIESNNPNQILFSDNINQENDAVIDIKGKTILETYINDNNNKSFYNIKSTDFLDNNTNYVSDEIVDNNNYNMSDTTDENNNFESINSIDDETNHIISSFPNKDDSTNSVEDIKINEPTIKSTEIIIKTKTTQIQKDEDRETEEIKKEDENYFLYCYQTICEFEKNIREEFELKIEPSIYKIDINSGESDIQATFKEQKTYNIKKCYLIKNIFKQVLKYRTNDSEKKITFLFIAKILSKIEKNEQIIVSVDLKKKEKTIRNLENEKKNSTCYSMYDAEPIEGEEVLVSYNCEVNNIEKPSQYSGLVFTYSADVDEITDDPDLQDPAITDELIKNGKIQDHSIVTFNSETIDTTECQKNGKFEIKGKLNGKVEETLYLVLYLYLDGNKLENASCNVPKASWKQISISCEVKNNFHNSKISIPSYVIRNFETNETIINITSVNSELESTCIIESELTDSIQSDIPMPAPTIVPDTTIIQDIISTELIFRQISHLEIDSSSNKIKLNLICFTFNNLHKNSYLMVVMKLIKSNADNEEKNATCFLNNDINENINYLNPLSLDCEINDINDITKVNDIQIISSPLIKNIPNENSVFTILTYAKMTDELIEKGELKDYIKEENNIPPMLSNLLINTESCNQDGIFFINCFIDTKIETRLFFYLELDDPITKVRCQIPLTEANTRVDIQCSTMNEFYNSKIEIDSKIVYDIKYNELLYINRTVSNNIANCKSNKELKMVEALKKLDAIYSFRQVSKFKKEDNKYKFFLATFIKEKIDKSMKLNLQVEIKREISKKNLNIVNKRILSDKETKNAECSPTMITNINEVGVGAAGWDCITEESSIVDAIGLDLVNSEDISGIPPNNSALIDPAKTDLLIESGEVKDYSIEENLNELLPIFNILSLNFSFCKKNGTFNFEGDISATTFKDVVFNLSLTYPEAIFACRLPRSFKGKKAVIECYNRDNFENDPILVEETVIRDGLNEYVILRNYSSGESYVTCSTSESKIKEQIYNDDINIISKTTKDGKTGGIGVGGIIAISVVGTLVLAAIIVLIVMIKKKYKKKTLNNNDKNIVSITGSSFGTSSSPSIY